MGRYASRLGATAVRPAGGGGGGGGGGTPAVDGVAIINALSPKCLISAASVTGVGEGEAIASPVSDLSGNGNNATVGGTGPLFSPTGAPNNSGAFIQRAGGWLVLPASGIWGGATAGHAFIFTHPTAGVNYGPWGLPGEDNFPWTDSIYSAVFSASQYNYGRGLIPVVGQWSILEVVSTGSVRKARINGADLYSASAAWYAPPTAVICGTNGGTGDAKFSTAGFVAFDRALDDTDAATVRAGLQAIHGKV